ncbi:MAG: SAM-dependent methyltransferase [Bacteroidales bacterium]|nr:SAM-dependent methyltransferase [Bacteroidales bacterium]
MKVFEANITHQVSAYLNNSLKTFTSLEKANQKMHDDFGIIHFFDNNEELETLKEIISVNHKIVEEPDRVEYGDFQTNSDLANKVILHLSSREISPEILIEPTCGKGNFIIASLRSFKNIKNIYGVEIYKPYVWETKFSIVDFFLNNTNTNKPKISIIHCNIFDYKFEEIAKTHSNKNVLVIGNPPWVTNSKLGGLNSTNLPKKTNFKNHSGLDAMTGKGNFDIAEFITLTMIKTFQSMKGNLLLLVKNSVIKNIVYDQRKYRYKISTIEKHCIDSKKEFNVSVEAALLYCQLNSPPTFECSEFNFYNNKSPYLRFGWFNDKFVSNFDTYIHTRKIDGECPFVWRQGLKHDCSTVMELDKVNGYYINGLNEEVKLEDGLVYGFLKSSDLKNTVINRTRKFTIVTQKKVGQETNYIKTKYPNTYQYLLQHQAYFDARKSSIYNNKPLFSIFGIGDYSFKTYKVAISGLYKTFHFTLILPQDNKPVMLDDTCYLIGFEKVEFAVYSLILLNSDTAVQFLQSVTFADAKRTFTKDVLMRINLLELGRTIDKQYLDSELIKLNEKYKINLSLDLWDSFINVMKPIKESQMKLFG